MCWYPYQPPRHLVVPKRHDQCAPIYFVIVTADNHDLFDEATFLHLILNRLRCDILTTCRLEKFFFLSVILKNCYQNALSTHRYRLYETNHCYRHFSCEVGTIKISFHDVEASGRDLTILCQFYFHTGIGADGPQAPLTFGDAVDGLEQERLSQAAAFNPLIPAALKIVMSRGCIAAAPVTMNSTRPPRLRAILKTPVSAQFVIATDKSNSPDDQAYTGSQP